MAKWNLCKPIESFLASFYYLSLLPTTRYLVGHDSEVRFLIQYENAESDSDDVTHDVTGSKSKDDCRGRCRIGERARIVKYPKIPRAERLLSLITSAANYCRLEPLAIK